MTRRVTGMRHSKLRDAVGQIRNADLARAALENAIDAAEVHRRQILAVRIAGAVLNRARDTNHALHAAVVRRDFRVRNGPIDIISVAAGRAEIDIAETRRRPAPEVGFAANGEAAPPSPFGSRSRGENDLAIPNALGVLVIHVADPFLALGRLAKPAERHIVGLSMVAEVRARIQAAAGVECANLRARLAKGVNGHPAARACPNHNYVVDPILHFRLSAAEGAGVPDRRYADKPETPYKAANRDNPTHSARRGWCSSPSPCSAESGGRTLAPRCLLAPGYPDMRPSSESRFAARVRVRQRLRHGSFSR